MPSNVIDGGVIQASDVADLYSLINGGLDALNLAALSIGSVQLIDSSVSVSKLKTTFSTAAVAQAAGLHKGGGYFDIGTGAFGHVWGVSGSLSTTYAMVGGDTTTVAGDLPKTVSLQQGVTANPIFYVAVFDSTVTGSAIAVLTSWYHQASPPYDLGDGEIPLFVFANIDGSGDVKGLTVSQDPPWLDPMRHAKRIILPYSWEDAYSDPAKMDEMMAAVDKPVLQSRPTDQAYKNRLKDLHPHPFVDKQAGMTPVLMDPVGKMAERLLTLHLAGEPIHEMVFGGYLKIDVGKPVKRAAPSGLLVASSSWKSTQ